jgi:CubicO group peptidase (beta-lactamase class C family)
VRSNAAHVESEGARRLARRRIDRARAFNGAISKPVTSTALFRLIEEGRL